MQINVNGQNYSRWEDVPAEVRQQLAATLPDADKNGVPDLFEGPRRAAHRRPDLRQHLDHGERAAGPVGGRPAPRVQAKLQQAFGMLGPMFGTRRPAAPPGTPAARPAERAVAAAARSGDAQRRPDHRRRRHRVKKPWWKRLFGG